MTKNEVLRCLEILLEGQHQFSGAVYLGLEDTKEYVEGFEDPLPKDLLNGTYSQKLLGGGSIPVGINGYINHAMREIQDSDFSGLVNLKKKHPEMVQDIDGLEDLEKLVLQLRREHLVPRP